MTRPTPSPQGHLLVQDADGRQRRIPIDRDLTLGRAPDGGGSPPGHVAIAGADLSVRHALVTRQDGGHYITDISGSCGTRVNGRPVRRKTLAPGDIITLGSSPVRLEFVHEATADPPAEAAAEAQRRTRQLTALLAGLHASPTRADICAAAAGIVMRAVDAEWAALALRGPGGDLRIVGAADASGRLPEAPTRIALQVMAAGRSCFHPCRLCVPVETGDRRLGVLEVGPRSDRRYAAHDLELLEAIATHVGVALGNVRRLELQPGYASAAGS